MNPNRCVALAALVILAAAPLSAQTGLTIYNSGRVLVRRALDVKVPKGASEHRVTLGTLEPATLFPLDPAVSLLGATYDGGTDAQSTLRRSVGRSLLFTRGPAAGDTVRATLLAVDPERFRYADGSIGFQAPGMPRFPADVVIVDPTVSLSLHSTKALPSLGLGYFTSGASWEASYQIVLGGKDARVTGEAVVQSGALSVSNADVQLLAGDVGVVSQAKQWPQAQRAMAGVAMEVAGPATEQSIGEAHLYTLPGKVSLQPGQTTIVALFTPTTAPVTKRLVVHSGLPYWGGLQQYGDEQEVPVAVTYVVTRALKTPFGDTPLPGGTARIYEADAAGRLQLIGASGLGHTAAGQAMELDAGTAFDYTARRTQTTYTTTRDKNRSTATADYLVTLANATDAAVTIDVLEERGGDWQVLQSSLPSERVSSTRVRFRVTVPPKGEATLTYRVKVTW